MAVKFGLSQINNPAPIVYKRILNFLIIFLIPSTATLVVSLPTEALSDTARIIIGLITTYIVALLKGAEYLIGDVPSTDSGPPK